MPLYACTTSLNFRTLHGTFVVGNFGRSNLSDTRVGNKMSVARERTFSLGLTDNIANTHKQTQVIINSGYNGISMVIDYKQLGSLKSRGWMAHG